MEPAHALIHMYTAWEISWGKQGNAVILWFLIPQSRSFYHNSGNRVMGGDRLERTLR